MTAGQFTPNASLRGLDEASTSVAGLTTELARAREWLTRPVVRTEPPGADARQDTRQAPQRADAVHELTATSYFGISTRARLPVVVSWHVDGAAEVEVTGVGRCAATGSATRRVDRTTRVGLTARSCFGVSVSHSVEVQVIVPAALATARRSLAPRACSERPVERHPECAMLVSTRRRSS